MVEADLSIGLLRTQVEHLRTEQATVDIGPCDRVVMRPSPAADAMSAAADEAQPAAPPCLAGARVLLVEDGSTNRKLISLYLRRAGMEVATAENGQVGVTMAGEVDFDLILMDMQMPVMDGYTAARRLRTMGIAVPIVALTAHAMSGDEQKCLAAGCSAYLSKPISADRLVQTLADVVLSARSPVGVPESGCAEPAALHLPAAVHGPHGHAAARRSDFGGGRRLLLHADSARRTPGPHGGRGADP